MQKQSFNTFALIVIICCFATFLSGCNASKNDDSADNVSVLSPTQTTPPNNETQRPGSISPTQITLPNSETHESDRVSPTPTTKPNNETQTPDSTAANHITPSESVPASALEIGLDDGTEVKLIVSGQEVATGAVIVGDEVLIPDFSSVFGRLKDASGIENAGFWSAYVGDTNTNIMSAVIENSLYSIRIVEGEYSFTCNDETILLTVPAQTIDKHFYLPLVALAEAINATVEWDADTQAIKFSYK